MQSVDGDWQIRLFEQVINSSDMKDMKGVFVE